MRYTACSQAPLLVIHIFLQPTYHVITPWSRDACIEVMGQVCTDQKDWMLVLKALPAPRYRDQRDRPDLTNPDSLALYLESRFEQLRVSSACLNCEQAVNTFVMQNNARAAGPSW